MKWLALVPPGTNVDFIGKRYWSLGLSIVLTVVSLVSIAVQGFNFGIDFKGGVLMEVRMQEAPNLGELRAKLSALDFGEVSLQEFGAPEDILIRVQTREESEKEEIRVIDAVKAALGSGVDFRRTEFVGPKVGAELVRAGFLAVFLSLVGISVYVWFRFEWQFGVGALVSTIHDIVTTLGLFSLFQIEFSLTTVAAVLTIAGYSVNDTVVIYDRIRENMRKYKKMPITELINRSNNETLARSVITHLTTLLAVLALLFFGGQVIRGFSIAMVWGIFVGTYSSVFVAVPVLVYLNLRPGGSSSPAETAAQQGAR
ncbi:MAG: protein translocase subunit SecF [Alphaproteobacteria bacterium]